MVGELRHRRRFGAKQASACRRLHRAERKPCRRAGPDAEDGVDRADSRQRGDLLVAIPRKLIEDHLAGDVGIDMDLVACIIADDVSRADRCAELRG